MYYFCLNCVLLCDILMLNIGKIRQGVFGRTEKEKKMETIKKYLKRYFIDAMGAMALGLFASLLIGTIFKALGMIPHLEFLAEIGGYPSRSKWILLRVNSPSI